jgi:hypothetical protein
MNAILMATITMPLLLILIILTSAYGMSGISQAYRNKFIDLTKSLLAPLQN